MAYNTKAIKTDVNGNPISQYYNPETDEYEPVEGAGGGNAVILYNEDGTPNNSLNFGEILDKLDQLTGTVIAEQTRQQNEAIRQQNEQQRIDLYNALKDLDVSQYELRLQKLEHDTSVEETVVKEAYGPVILLPENTINGQINEISIFGNTEIDEDNVKSTFGAIRLKSVGKNLFDRNRAVEHYAFTWATGALLAEPKSIASDFIQVIPGQQYYINYKSQIMFYDANKTYLGSLQHDGVTIAPIGGAITNSFTVPNIGNIKYMRLGVRSSANGDIDLTKVDNIQLEKGIQATEYEPYKESTLYVIAKDEEGNILELRSLPNGVKDEIRLADGKAIIRTSKLTLDGTESGWQTQSTSNQKVLSVYIPVANLQPLAGDNLSGQRDSVILEGFTTGIVGMENTDNINTVNYNRTGVNLIIDIALERLETPDISGFKKWLGEKRPTLIYQLAEPIEIPVEVFGNLQSYENGTVYVDTIIPRVDFYTPDGIYLENEPSIKEIDSLYLVNKENGLLTPLDISKAFIFPDGKGFTHPDLFTGALVDWDYIPDVESTSPAISMKLPTNLKASVTSTLQGVQELSSETKNLNTRVIANRRDIYNLQDNFATLQSDVSRISNELDTHKADYVNDMAKKANKQQEDWTNLTLQNGWTVDRYARVFKDEFGIVYLQINAVGGVTDGGTEITRLPAKFRPDVPTTLFVSTGDIRFTINSGNGAVVLSGNHPGLNTIGINIAFRGVD